MRRERTRNVSRFTPLLFPLLRASAVRQAPSPRRRKGRIPYSATSVSALHLTTQPTAILARKKPGSSLAGGVCASASACSTRASNSSSLLQGRIRERKKSAHLNSLNGTLDLRYPPILRTRQARLR